MTAVLLVGVAHDPADLDPSFFDAPVQLEPVASPQGLLKRIEQDTQVGLVVIGADVSEPVRLAQRIHALNKQIALLIQCSEEALASIRRALMFAPFLGDDVTCIVKSTVGALASAITETLKRAQQRTRYQSMVSSANARLQAAAARPPSEAHFLNRILDFAPIGIVHTDLNGDILAVNRAAANLLERRERDALGLSFAGFFAEAARSVSTLIEQAFAADDEVAEAVVERQQADGPQFLSVGATALRVPGQPASAIVLLEDVTRRIRAEQARAETLQLEQQARQQAEAARERFALLAEVSVQLGTSLDVESMLANLPMLLRGRLADSCVIDLVEPGGAIRRVEEWIGPVAGHRFLLDWNTLHPTVEALLGGVPVFLPDMTEADNVLADTSDGVPYSLIAVPLSLRRRMLGAITLARTRQPRQPFTDEDLELALEVARRAALAVDNARLYAEADDQREYLRVTLASIGDAVIVTDNSGHISFLNATAEQVTGWTHAEAIGKPLEEVFKIINEYSRQTVPSPVSTVLQTGQIVGLANHTLLIRNDGFEVPIDDSGAPIVNTQNEIVGVVLVFRDVTERKQIERQREQLLEQEQIARQAAEAANEQKLRFLSMVSHELRTPLTSIKGFATTLLSSEVDWDGQEVQEFLGIIDLEADRLHELVDHLLDVSRLHAGNLRLSPAPHAVCDLIDAAKAQLQILTAAHELRIDVSDTLPTVLADPQRVAQVLVNLVGNAVKFSPPTTPITIRALAQPDAVKVTVSDTGIGISDAEAQYVFEAFRQGSQWPRQGGAGLGLAICKGLVEAHGGRIWIDADHVGPGVTLAFTLPRVAPETPLT